MGLPVPPWSCAPGVSPLRPPLGLRDAPYGALPVPAGWYVQSIRLPWVSALPSAEGLQEKPCSQALGSNAASTWVPVCCHPSSSFS